MRNTRDGIDSAMRQILARLEPETVRVAKTCRYALKITLTSRGSAVLTPVKKTVRLKVKQAG